MYEPKLSTPASSPHASVEAFVNRGSARKVLMSRERGTPLEEATRQGMLRDREVNDQREREQGLREIGKQSKTTRRDEDE